MGLEERGQEETVLLSKGEGNQHRICLAKFIAKCL